MKDVLFSRTVGSMKAWELYTAQSLWFFFIGIVFFLAKYLLDKTFLKKSDTFQDAYSVVEKLGTGQADALDGKLFAQKLI